MIGGKAAPAAAASCASPNEEVLALGRKLGVPARRRSSLPTARAFLARSTPRCWKKNSARLSSNPQRRDNRRFE
jgi:hypothetical protein